MALVDTGDTIIVKPNSSLSTEGGTKVLAVLLLIILLVTLSFVNMGAWLVLPFAGLEFLAFLYAFYTIYMHAEDYESIYIDDEHVLIEKKCNKQLSSVTFKRYWAHVTLRTVSHKNSFIIKTGLFIGSHGKEVEFGHGLISEAQRPQLALRITQKIKNINH